MCEKQVIVISDIHIGTNKPTNWYQQTIHEPYLAHIFESIIQNQAEVEELVILGDLFDFWSYAPDEVPPTALEIVQANPNILGPNGLLSKVYDALDGKVSYVTGNHDMSITQADLNEVGNPEQTIKLQPDVYVKDGVVYTHGHLYTLFNAPDEKEPLPVGHFVTRAISYYLKKNNKHAADEPDFGIPDMDRASFSEILDNMNKLSVAEGLLNHIQTVTGIPDDCEIKLERDFGCITFRDAKNKYSNLWTEWSAKHADEGGDLNAYKAAWADYDGSYLGWFAEQISMENVVDLVVMGHTHIPKAGIKDGISQYMNTGFECVASPDLPKKNITYGAVATDTGKPPTYKIMKVISQNDQYISKEDQNVSPVSPLGDLAKDYSCYITCENKSCEDYILDSHDCPYGYYSVLPPKIIRAGQTVKFWVQDKPGPEGSEGHVTYKGTSTGQIVPLVFRCTTVMGPNNSNANLCSGTNEFYSKSGKASNDWGKKNVIKQSGHPFFARFIIGTHNENQFVKEGKSLVAADGTALKVNECLRVNGSTDLSDILTDKDDSKVFSIKLEKSSNPAYAYVITVDGQGPKAGLYPWKAAETLKLTFYNQEGEIDFLTIYRSAHCKHYLWYSSDAPYITKITWTVVGKL